MTSVAEIRTRRTAMLINELVEKIYPMAPLKVFSAVTRELFRADSFNPLVETETANLASIGMDLLKLKGEDAVDLYTTLSESDPIMARKLLVMMLKLGGHLNKRDDPILVLNKEDPTEREKRLQTLKDFLTAIQGVAGHYLKNESRGLLLTKGEEQILVGALEVGKKIAKVRMNAVRLAGESSLGVVSQRFGHALQDELSGFDRFVSILEQQALNGDGKGERIHLQQLHAWTSGVFRRIDILAHMYESTESLRGGALCSAVFAHTFHGNPSRVQLANRIVKKIFVPIEEMISEFISTGRLPNDPHYEFFVVRRKTMNRLDDNIDGNDIYAEFSINSSMVPSFLGSDFAERVMTTGCECRVAHKLNLSKHTSLVNAPYAEDGEDDLGSVIKTRLQLQLVSIEMRANKAVIESLMKEHHLMEHLMLLKRFVLLGQGDFAQHLIELTAGLLAQPVNEVSRMELLSCVEQASETSLVGDLGDVFASRIDCFVLEDDRSALAWDAFSLDYHVDFPLDLIINMRSRVKYQKVFRFLWRLKRVQYGLEQAWKHQQNATGRRVESEPFAVRGVVHKCHLVRSEMVYFATNLLSYVMFEVLETSFEQLKCDIQEAGKLVDLIAAHESYLEDVLVKALIVDEEDEEKEDEVFPESRKRVGAPASKSPIFALRSADLTRRQVKGLSTQLDLLFDIVLRFCALQEHLFMRISEERQTRALMRRSKLARAREAQWKNTSPQLTGDDADVDEEALNAGAKAVAEEYGEQVDAIASEFWDSLSAFLNALDSSASDNLRFLGLRLDFNRFY